MEKEGKTIRIMQATPNSLYQVDHLETAGVAAETATLLNLHCQLGHISGNGIRVLIKCRIITGISLNDSTPILTYNSCEYGKTTYKAI